MGRVTAHEPRASINHFSLVSPLIWTQICNFIIEPRDTLLKSRCVIFISFLSCPKCIFFLVCCLKLNQRVDDSVETKPFYCHNTLPEPALNTPFFFIFLPQIDGRHSIYHYYHIINQLHSFKTTIINF